ncbi:MAG: S41 family peptidase [Oscillospiraceae bacterium]
MPKHRPSSVKIICTIVFTAVMLTVLTFAYMRSNTDFFSRKVTLDTYTGMTEQQHIDDFELLCEHIESNIPTLYSYESLYGISYDETKAYYKAKVENAESDIEYYSLLQGFLNNIPSCHLSVGFPMLSSMDEDFSKHLSKNDSFVNAQNYWFETIHNECKKHYDEDITQMIFAYYSGKYLGIAEDIDNDIYSINKAELLTVNGIDIDEFVKLNSLSGKLKFDHVNNKPFRDVVIFNNVCGEECTVEYITENGEKREDKMYYGANSNTIISYIDYFKFVDGLSSETDDITSPKTDCVKVGDLNIYKSKEKDLLLVKINQFLSPESPPEVIENTIIQYSKDVSSIIIDISSNKGGYYEYAKAVLGAISDKDIQTESEVYITKDFYDRINNKRLYKFDKESGLYRTFYSESIKGKAPERKNVCLIISDSTGSSADNLAWEFKRNSLGTVIGTNNTGGERDGTICLNYNDISGIYYTYTAYAAKNPNGTFSSVEGTAPDIYVQQPIEAYFMREEIKRSGEDPYTIENRLKWDSVFVKAIEIIGENN